MITFKKRRFIVILALSVLFFIVAYSNFYLSIDLIYWSPVDFRKQDKVIIWWTPFFVGDKYIQCGEVSCLVSNDRKYSRNVTSAYLFYGTNFNKNDLPLPRGNIVWALLHEESPRNSPILNHDSVLGLFNFSSTFSRFSNLPLTFQYLPSLESLTSLNFFKTFDEKSNSNFAPVIYIQSDCVTPNNRDSYVAELMKYMQIDSYGNCLNNKPLPDRLKNGVETMMSPELLNILGYYKFTISFENAVCEDYITEKLWRSLIVGSVPIYAGSPSIKVFATIPKTVGYRSKAPKCTKKKEKEIKFPMLNVLRKRKVAVLKCINLPESDWLPNKDTAILPEDFVSPKELAKYLQYLSENSSAYNEYLKHKIHSKISNDYLISNYKQYQENFNKETIITDFECLICRKLHEEDNGYVNKYHYDCRAPVSIVNKKYNASNWWHDDYFVSKCEAELLRSFIDRKVPIKKMKFNC